MEEYKTNHYVPQWFQKTFIPDSLKDKKFHYLDFNPKIHISNNRIWTDKAIQHWGSPSCFCEEDLYTIKFGMWESTEIESEFFGAVDREGHQAVEYISKFDHDTYDPDQIESLLRYLSIQKLRTVKGLRSLSELVSLDNKNLVLDMLQQLQVMFCATWSECVWSIADATNSQYKFILSDHPVTIFNQKCRQTTVNDPDILANGSHTIFPLNLNKILILTNLSWARNPYTNPLIKRPNPRFFGRSQMDMRRIQIGRLLSDDEVLRINYIIKKRAHRFVAAVEKEWLFPENSLNAQNWEQLGSSYLLMPDPRLVIFERGTITRQRNGSVESVDPFGHRNWHPDQSQEADRAAFEVLIRFREEFENLFGPERRGRVDV